MGIKPYRSRLDKRFHRRFHARISRYFSQLDKLIKNPESLIPDQVAFLEMRSAYWNSQLGEHVLLMNARVANARMVHRRHIRSGSLMENRE